MTSWSGSYGRQVGFTTIDAISAYHLNSTEYESRSWRGVLNITLCDKVCQWLAIAWWFSSDTPVSFTSKTDHHDIAEILLKVALNTITLNPCDILYCFKLYVLAILIMVSVSW
jgi:hypothetical protein